MGECFKLFLLKFFNNNILHAITIKRGTILFVFIVLHCVRSDSQEVMRNESRLCAEY